MLVASLLCQVVLATAALAIPSSRERLAERVARRAAGFTHRSQPNQFVEFSSVAEVNAKTNALTKVTKARKVSYSGNWSGAVLSAKNATYNSVTATFVVPRPKEPSGATGRHSVAAWVGIDGASCGRTILQTGVDFTVNGNAIGYTAWCEWFPFPSHDFSGISFKPGDEVTLTVTATSSTSGKATITNKSTGKTVSQSFSGAKVALCQENAEWIVEDFSVGGKQVPLSNFGNLVFRNATAHTLAGKTVGPAGSTLIDMVHNNTIVSKGSTGNRTVTVSYVG
ncbi:acid proteinase [Ganoderma leucocontextum]|nr:acid proteinase [Ganoderma leucocontextum]